MQKAVLLPLFFFSLIAGQDSLDQRLFKTTEAHYRLGKYEIIIRQRKRLKEISGQKEFDTHVGPICCSALVDIKENGKLINRVEFKDIQPLGAPYGIHLPIKQESSKHFILVKWGDYDSRTIVITAGGELINLGGGTFRIFLNRYLVSPRGLADDPSLSFSILDLDTNELILSTSELMLSRTALALATNSLPLLPPDKRYIVKFFTNGPELFAGVVVLDFSSGISKHPKSLYRINLETGEIMDAEFDESKHKEFVIDGSNVDSSNDCECIKTGEK